MRASGAGTKLSVVSPCGFVFREHLSVSLKRRTFFASLWSLLGSGGEQAIGLLLFIYVARKVTPADVGLIALAMVFIEILTFVARSGQVETIQRLPELDERTLSTSFWMLATSGVLFCGLILAGGEASTAWWDAGLFGTVLLMLAPVCALKAWNAVPEALLKRRFDYRSLAVRTWLATLIGGGTGALLAYLDFGVYALVAQRLTTTLISTITCWTASGWRPRFGFDLSAATRLLRFGGVVMTAKFAGLVNENLVQSLAGFGLGAAPVGFLRVGWRFFDFINHVAVQPVSNVALSSFAPLQSDPEAFKRAYLRLTQLVAMASLPMYFGLGLVADIFVPLALGAKWAGAILVMQLLAFTRLAAPISYLFGPAMIAMGRSRALLGQSVVQVTLTFVLVSVGLFFGIVGVLVALMVRGVLNAAYQLFQLRKEVGLRPRTVLKVLLPPASACIVMAVAVELTKYQLTGDVAEVWLLAILVGIGAGVYFAALLAGEVIGLWPGYVRGATDSLQRALRQKPKSAPTPA
jgi:PST family polysaccharide transporter